MNIQIKVPEKCLQVSALLSVLLYILQSVNLKVSLKTRLASADLCSIQIFFSSIFIFSKDLETLPPCT